MPMFVPGPVDVAPEVAQAQTKPMVPHRSPEFEALFHSCEQRARDLFHTQYRVFLLAASGTAFQEACVRNLVRERILVVVNGAFGKRWAEVARTNGKETDVLEVEWGKGVRPEQVAEALRKKRYDVLAVVHNETSTGVENPLKDIAAAAREVAPEIFICVDSVSGLGGAPLYMDEWGLDVVFTSSQKCLALPPGLALAGVSDRALKQAEKVPHRGWYLDFLRLEKHRLKDSTPATPPVALIYALDVQLDRIFREGLEQRWARHRRMAEMTRQWALDHGFALFAEAGYRSQTLTTVTNSRGLDIARLNAFLLERGMRIANGYGPLKHKTFRIAHMGEIQPRDLEALFQALEDFMASA